MTATFNIIPLNLEHVNLKVSIIVMVLSDPCKKWALQRPLFCYRVPCHDCWLTPEDVVRIEPRKLGPIKNQFPRRCLK